MDNFLLIQPYLKLVGFEPDERAYAALPVSRNAIYLDHALFNRPAQLDFYINKNPLTSSLLRPNRAFLALFPGMEEACRCLRTVRVNVTTLDEALCSKGISQADFVKLDTQGTELFILEGGKRTLSTCFGLEVEVEFYPLYENQPLFSDVCKFLRDEGFALFDLRPVYWKRAAGLEYGKPKGQIVWADALFFKEARAFYESLKNLGDVEKFLRVLKAVLILALYGYLDFGLEILGELKKMVIDPDIAQNVRVLENAIMKRHFSSRIPYGNYRYGVAALFHFLYKTFRVFTQKHGVGERDLGNL